MRAFHAVVNETGLEIAGATDRARDATLAFRKHRESHPAKFWTSRVLDAFQMTFEIRRFFEFMKASKRFFQFGCVSESYKPRPPILEPIARTLRGRGELPALRRLSSFYSIRRPKRIQKTAPTYRRASRVFCRCLCCLPPPPPSTPWRKRTEWGNTKSTRNVTKT